MNGTGKANRRLLDSSEFKLEEFEQLCSRDVDAHEYPLASSVEKRIPIYDLKEADPNDDALCERLQNEWYNILYSGPGVFVLRGMYDLPNYKGVLEATNAAFDRIIERELREFDSKGDHFDTAGKNQRIWNSFGKHAIQDPESFVKYYSNPWLELVSESWLGPGYRISAQVNNVTPGGVAQRSHTDYHLGLQEQDQCSRFPRALQNASKHITLQGAVAHSDMPLDSGPTRLLPFSQQYEPGFLTWRNEKFREYFGRHYVSLPLKLGDGLFFNPGIFHAAGSNDTDPEGGFVRRANLLQIHCTFGRAMESIDTIAMVDKCWEAMKKQYKTIGPNDIRMKALIHAVGDAYPFPTNLDLRPPHADKMMPENEQEVLTRALEGDYTREQVLEELEKIRKDSIA